MNLKKQTRKLLLTLFILFYPLLLFSQKISDDYIKEFIDCLIYDKEELNCFIDLSEINISNRLDIQYENVSNKYMISYDIDENIKEKIRQNKLKYNISIQALGDVYVKVVFNVAQINYKKVFFFKDKMLISPITYYTGNWYKIKSPHFVFVISDTTLFNSYCIKNMENYFSELSSLLDFNESQLERIENNKIYYFLCKNVKEIKQLTGFNTRGMYILAFDYIVTTYNAHYHELSHLLINYKLKNLPLYTHPFFQEGFAVAFGGRGGKEPNIILNLSSFLIQSHFLDYTYLLNKNAFYQYDASLSYPVSGGYNYYLFNKLGIMPYLYLYRKYSGSAKKIEADNILKNELPEPSGWHDFVNHYDFSSIRFNKPNKKTFLVYKDKTVSIFEDSERYYFELKDTLLIRTPEIFHGYHSKRFNVVFPDRKYKGEKYIIVVNKSEISIYNLFTNNLIENFTASFSLKRSSSPKENGVFKFNVLKNIFDEKLKNGCVFYN